MAEFVVDECLNLMLNTSVTFVDRTNTVPVNLLDVENLISFLVKLKWCSSFPRGHYHLQTLQLSPFYLKSVKL